MVKESLLSAEHGPKGATGKLEEEVGAGGDQTRDGCGGLVRDSSAGEIKTAGWRVYFEKSHQDLPKDGPWVWKTEESRMAVSS